MVLYVHEERIDIRQAKNYVFIAFAMAHLSRDQFWAFHRNLVCCPFYELREDNETHLQ